MRYLSRSACSRQSILLLLRSRSSILRCRSSLVLLSFISIGQISEINYYKEMGGKDLLPLIFILVREKMFQA